MNLQLIYVHVDHQDEQVGKREDNTHEVTRGKVLACMVSYTVNGFILLGGFCALSSSQHTEKQQETRYMILYSTCGYCYLQLYPKQSQWSL